MAESFRGAIGQVLLKKTTGGRIAGREILVATAHTARLIGDGHTDQLPLALEEGRKHGMASFTTVLTELVRSGAVDVREAFRKAPDRQQLLDSLRRSGVDTTMVDRLV
jgi:twitching motility protein PilT